MEEERVCVVLYKPVDDTYHFAVLKRVKNWAGWELVKGHLDGSPEETARQEVAEEAGIDDVALEPLDFDLTWEYEDDDGETVHITCHCFLAEADADARVDVSENPHDEHEAGYFLNYRDATDVLHFDDQRELLEHAHEVLTEDA